jgi:hypothetical protein
MDPRIAWYPNELIGNAFSTWSTIWMYSQINQNNTNQTNNITLNSIKDTTSNSHSTPNLLAHHHMLNHNNNYVHSTVDLTHTKFENNPNLDISIINGLRNRKFNKASTFGFNFPINQYMLDDPMSTPWMANLTQHPQQPQIIINQIKSDVETGSTGSSVVLSTSSTSSTDLSTTTSSNHQNVNIVINQNHLGFQDQEFYMQHDSPYLSTSNEMLNMINDEDGGIGIRAESSSSSVSVSCSPSPSQLDLNSSYYSEGLVNLHKEILLFSDYIAPTGEEMYTRNEIIWRITKVIKDQFPQAQVDIFGSYKTGLFLPTSDIE